MGGAGAVAGVLVAVLARHREEFATALHSAPAAILVAAVALQLVALLARTEAWWVCVGAAGGTVGRRRLFRAAGIGYLGSQPNGRLGAAARIATLRRTAPDMAPRLPALIAAELPILLVEGALAAIASFTLIGPLGLPWWAPVVCLAGALLVGGALQGLCRGHDRGFWKGLAVLRSASGRARMIVLVLVAVFAQITRNWLMLHAVGVDATVFDATAVLIAIVALSQLPVGPSVGAAAAVLILGSAGPAAVAAAGVLLTATGTAGALAYVAWAGFDRLLLLRRLAGGRARRGERLTTRARPAVAQPGVMLGQPQLVPAVSVAGPRESTASSASRVATGGERHMGAGVTDRAAPPPAGPEA